MFRYHDGRLLCESVDLRQIAEVAGTPCYVYSAGSIRDRYREYDFAFRDLPHTICYAAKANSTLAVLHLLAELGSGFDIVSGGELYRVLKAGGDPSKIVFSGVGKTAAEIEFAIESGIHSFNCESEAELEIIDGLGAGRKVNVAIRVNPDVNAATHPYISTGLTAHKFGIDIRRAEHIYAHAARLPNLRAVGISCHIGSQMLDTAPMVEAARKILALVERLRAAGHQLRYMDLGGGLGIAYRPEESSPQIFRFVEPLYDELLAGGLEIFVEPGRSIVGAAGMLLTRVLYRKHTPSKEFVIVDAAMNDLIRPALYGSHHEILPLEQSEEVSVVDVVGPVCETGDFFARDRELAGARTGSLLAVAAVGAYGFAQSSNYNSRPRAAEVLVDGDHWRVVRERETFEDLTRGERV
ncbi:diaminopimelate decarboxylase [Nevskia soli]|uniref:diaminopimelate decarboxylase n=1 Tax=Nevskia soli TaxID=418856 RepID=UPI0015D83BAA|nr:diaminopimelate decarboxylase [Nevskia soli]